MRYIIIGLFLLTVAFLPVFAESQKETISIRSLFPTPGGAINTTEDANLAVGDDNAKVGIGTDDPQSKLGVDGGVAIGSGYAGTNTAPDDGLIVEGRVGIGTPNPSAAFALDVVGAIRASAGLTVTGGTVSLPEDSIGSAEITDGEVDTDDIHRGAVTADKIDNEAVTAAKIHRDVAGAGLSGGGGNPLSVNVGGGIRIVGNTVELAPPASGVGTSYTCPGSITVDNLGRVTSCSSGTCGGGGGGSSDLTGSGTKDRIAIWTGEKSLGNSVIQQNGNGIGIDIAPSEKLHVNGKLRVGNTQIYDNEINRYTNDDLYIGYRNTANTFLQVNGGRVGIGTSNPASKLDVNGDVSAASFIAAGGIVKGDGYSLDASDGSPVDALYIDEAGRVGLGTTDPQYTLDVDGPALVVDAKASAGMGGLLFSTPSDRLKEYGNIYIDGDDYSLRFSMLTSRRAGNRSVESWEDKIIFYRGRDVKIGDLLTVTPVNVIVSTRLDVNGPIYQSGRVLHADYVFDPTYNLESIEEHAQHMWKYKHLKAVPGLEVDETGQEVLDIGAHRRGILEELEKAHIYIEQLNERIKSLEAKLAAE